MRELTIVGCGFAGLWAAMSAAAARHAAGAAAGDLSITLISPRPELVNRPRLYEGAGADLRIPVLPLLDEIKVNWTAAMVTGLDAPAGCATLDTGASVAFDRLVLAAGSRLQRPAIPGAELYGFSVDTFAETARLDAHLQAVSDNATIAVVGAGFTGLETVTELRSRLGPAVRLVLLERGPSVALGLGREVQVEAASALASAKVEVCAEAGVTSIDAGGLDLADGGRLDAAAVIFTSGLRASPLAAAIGSARDDLGRLVVDPYLRARDQPNVFAAGDAARAMTDDRHASLMSCQHAMPQGRYAGHNAVQDMLGRPMAAYRQEVYVTCLDLGPAGAVFSRGWARRVEMTGAEAKALKRRIMEDRIVPPDPGQGAAAIFAEIGLAADT